MTETFQIIIGVLQVLILAGSAAWGVVYYIQDRRWHKRMDQVNQKDEELKATLAAMNKFHNENITHKAAVDKQLRELTAQMASLSQMPAKPSFMR